MPGIVGLISQRPAQECESIVKTMTATMRHERFYVSSTYFVPELGIYAGSVAHEHSFAAGHAFFNEARDVALVISGECFFDSRVGIETRQNGHRMDEPNGTRIVHLYEEQGEKAFENLNGLFSGLLIDKRQGKAFLFNDRYALERIYYSEQADGFYFASEAKALLRVLPDSRSFDEDGVAQYLAFGCTLEERTLFHVIGMLPGASLWSFRNAKCQKRKYFSARNWESQAVLSPASFESRFQKCMKQILPRYFQSESRIGIALTGGLDTRMIMAALPETLRKPICYTFTGSAGLTVDDRLASRVAEACGLEHRLLRIGPDFLSDFADHADRTVYITDGCFGVCGSHELYLNRLARQLATMRLTGNYGSEVLRGVSTFKPLGISSALLSEEINRLVRRHIREFAASQAHPTTFAAFRNVPLNLFGSLAAGRSQVGFRSPYLDNELVELAYQAPQSLRRSQRPGLSFVKNNSETLSKIPTDKGYASDSSGLAQLVRRLFSRVTFKIDYFYNEGFSHRLSVFDRVFRQFVSRIGVVGLHKYLRYGSWFRRELSDYLNDSILNASMRQSPFWNASVLEHMVTEHIKGRKNYVMEINAVLTLEAIERLLFRDMPRGTRDLEYSHTEDSRKESPLSR